MTASGAAGREAVEGIVLAAGASVRAGCVKALAVVGGETLVARAARALREAGCARVTVVVADPYAVAVQHAVPAAGVVHNPAPQGGMRSSLALGLAASRARGAAAVVVSLVDHPGVRPSTIEALVAAWRRSGADLVRPRFAGRRGHPWVAGRDTMRRLIRAPPDASVRDVLRGVPGALDLDVDDAAVIEDLDTPGALAEAGAAPAGRLESAAYDLGSQAYDASGEDDPAWRERWRTRFASLLAGPRVLDAGGAGRDSAAFERAGLSVVGVDGSARLLEIARARCPASRFVRGDFTRPPRALAGERFDGIWSMFALLHVGPASLPGCLVAWRALVVPGGPFVLGMAGGRKITSRTVADWLGVSGNASAFHYHAADTTRSELEAAGFSVIEIVEDTPSRCRTEAYEEHGLLVYVVVAVAGG